MEAWVPSEHGRPEAAWDLVICDMATHFAAIRHYAQD
jgi:hypothetical protein